MNRTLIALSLAAALALPALASAQEQKRGPSTVAERRRVVEITRRLEKVPFSKSADNDRVWLMTWIDEVPDVNIRYCPGPLYGLIEGQYEGRAFWVQSLFGMSAYLVEHYPDREKADWIKVQIAGLESAIASYQTARKGDEVGKIPALEKLVKAKAAGTLAKVVREEMEACDPNFTPIPSDAI
ncbi:MAG: hypothetical protein QM704_22645 [Anaeromyxobacteraceae bacterium]